jgi:hypothetical protein
VDPLARSRRPLLIAALALATSGAGAACGAQAGPLAGASERPPGGAVPRQVQDGGPIEGATALPADYLRRFTKVNQGKLVSAGHASGRWEIEVWANESAQRALAARSRDVPVGAIVVEEHVERSGARGRGPVMVMEKRPKGFSPDHGDWRYTVVSARGLLVKDGAIEPCAGCHDDAPMDGLFPIVDGP